MSEDVETLQSLLTLSVHLSEPMALYIASERMYAIAHPAKFRGVRARRTMYDYELCRDRTYVTPGA